jgi:hypothetical protein
MVTVGGLFAFVMLLLHWWIGDYENRTKVVVTLMYLATFLLLMVGASTMSVWQGIFGVVLGIMTFGTEWSNHRV